MSFPVGGGLGTSELVITRWLFPNRRTADLSFVLLCTTSSPSHSPSALLPSEVVQRWQPHLLQVSLPCRSSSSKSKRYANCSLRDLTVNMSAKAPTLQRAMAQTTGILYVMERSAPLILRLVVHEPDALCRQSNYLSSTIVPLTLSHDKSLTTIHRRKAMC